MTMICVGTRAGVYLDVLFSAGMLILVRPDKNYLKIVNTIS